MKRRDALKNIVLVSAGIAVLPSCNTETFPTYRNIPLKRNQWPFIDQVAHAILPLPSETPAPQEESVTHFILTSLNDCYSSEDIKKYTQGLNEFQAYVKENYSADLKNISDEKLNNLLAYMSKKEGLPEAQSYFLGNMRNLILRRFTSSQDFMTNELKFEFAPGRYLGCVEV